MQTLISKPKGSGITDLSDDVDYDPSCSLSAGKGNSFLWADVLVCFPT